MWICGQPVLYSNIQARQGYIVRFYLRKLNKQTNEGKATTFWENSYSSKDSSSLLWVIFNIAKEVALLSWS